MLCCPISPLPSTNLFHSYGRCLCGGGGGGGGIIGGAVQTSVYNILEEHLGHCELFEERQVGDERYNVFTGCPR